MAILCSTRKILFSRSNWAIGQQLVDTHESRSAINTEFWEGIKLAISNRER